MIQKVQKKDVDFSISHDTMIISVLSLVYVFTIGTKKKRRRIDR